MTNQTKRLGQGYGFYHYRDNAPQGGWAEVIKAFRWHVLGMYQEELAALLNMSKASLCRLETGQRKVDEKTLNLFLAMVANEGEVDLSAATVHDQQRRFNHRRGREQAKLDSKGARLAY